MVKDTFDTSRPEADFRASGFRKLDHGDYSAPTLNPSRSSSIPNIASLTDQRPTRPTRSYSSPSLAPAQTRPRRQGSTASAPAIAEEDEDDQMRDVDGTSAPSIPFSPPYLSREEDVDFEAAQASEAARESFGGWHYAPLLVAMAPPVGALLGGHSDAWSDAILLILASFWLYQFLRVPWEVYYSARTRRVLSHEGGEEDDLEEASFADAVDSVDSKRAQAQRSSTGSSETRSSSIDNVAKRHAREAAATELRRSELLSLLLCILSPVIGAYLLHWMRETMVDGGRYLNAFNIRLFTLAAGIKPWSHAIKLIRRRMLHLQEEVHYPSAKVEGMNQRLRRLEADLLALRKLYATKNELRVLRESDAQLGRAVRRSERKEEHLRLTAEEKFSVFESRLEDLLREVAINAELIEEERRERERAASLRISLFEAVKYLLGSGLTVRRASPKHYLHDVPRSLPTPAALGIGMSSSSSSESSSPIGHSTATASRQMTHPPNGQTPSPYVSSTPNGAQSNSKRPSGQSSSPHLDPHMISKYYDRRNGPISMHHRHAHPHQVSHPWWERGMAFYLFLPLNVSSAAIRFAGEKVKSILEDPDHDVAVKQHRKKLQYQQHLTDHHQYQQATPSQPQPPQQQQQAKAQPASVTSPIRLRTGQAHHNHSRLSSPPPITVTGPIPSKSMSPPGGQVRAR
ncbi:hypothetical protein BCV70DRAFT_41154 [Testicularia cyperi]|uniref:Uncharacterized protein n=1 Tax=Testicularia cyperi TaxID=1882483 RepID=A0A317XLD4_9BASI|nr:hypothetical protein BCV70DRAFT_41154 [Testicularia cyperi]